MTPPPRLNFVVVMTDDQGWWSMPQHMPEIHMPRVAKLLDESLIFNNFYCASPVCSPARASLLTGRTPSAHGVHDWLVGGRSPESFPDLFLDGQPTTAETLAHAGYQCWLSGKWHVGDARRPAPGFTRWYAHRFGGGPYVNAPIWRDGEATTEPRYLTHAITEEALGFIADREADAPFYLQVNYTAPHDPWLEGHPVEYTSLYEDCNFPSIPRDPRHPWTLDQPHFDGAYADPTPHLVGYCASLSAVDEGVGRIIDYLETEGLRDHTAMIYLSDNGFSCGHNGIWGKGNATWPLNFFDNSVRVPFLVSLPDGLVGATDALTSATSLHATICELAGAQLPADRYRAGESFAAVLREPDASTPETVVVSSEYGQARMVTDGRWVYVHRRHGDDELYDHADDPTEQVNRAGEPGCAEVVRRLRGELEAWFAQRENAGNTAWNHDVRGTGQVHPIWRGRPDNETYATTPAPDGSPTRDPS